MLFIALVDKRRFFGANPGDFLETLRILFDYLQHFHAEMFDQQAGCMGPHAFNKAGGKKAFQPFRGGGDNGLPLPDLKLPAIAGMHFPFALEPQGLSLVQGREIPDNRNIFLPLTAQPADQVGGFVAVKSDALQGAFQDLHHRFAPLSK